MIDDIGLIKLIQYIYGYVNLKLSDISEIGTGSRNTQDATENGLYQFYVRSPKPLLLNAFDYDDISIITAGDGVGVGKVFHITNGKYALHQRAYRIHPTNNKIDTKYLYYYIKTFFYEYIMKSKYEGSVASIRLPMLQNFMICLPSLERQKQIVEILDKFEEYINSIDSGLKGEIELNHQRYEYYRDKLLTLERKVV